MLEQLGRGRGWPRLIEHTLRGLHVDPATGQEEDDACVSACYDCLLTFYNQQYHRVLDRRAPVGLLLALREKAFIGSRGADGYEPLLEHAEGIEADVLTRMKAHGLPAPDAGHKTISIEDAPVASADFFYEPKLVVFCDGSPHDKDYIAEADRAKRKKLKAKGYIVVAIHYDAMEEGVKELAKRLGL